MMYSKGDHIYMVSDVKSGFRIRERIVANVTTGPHDIGYEVFDAVPGTYSGTEALAFSTEEEARAYGETLASIIWKGAYRR